RLADEAAAQAAAEEAARQKASVPSPAPAPKASNPAPSAPAPTPSPAGLSITIWTTGGQAQVDARRGAVNFAEIASWLGSSFYAAEHWSSGGNRWQGIGIGSRVTVNGYG